MVKERITGITLKHSEIITLLVMLSLIRSMSLVNRHKKQAQALYKKIKRQVTK